MLNNKSCIFLEEARISLLAEPFIKNASSVFFPPDLMKERTLSNFFKPTFSSSVLSTVNLFHFLYSGSCLNICLPLPCRV